MSVHLPFTVAVLRETASQLIPNTRKGSLQEALLGSKLLKKDTPRDDLKRISSSPSTWLSYVFDRLEAPATKEAALRALSGLVDGALPNLDVRVANRMKKARAAAEQSDSERLIREIEGLNSLRREGIGPSLPLPIPTLYLWLKGQHAREQVVELINEYPDTPTIPAAELRAALGSPENQIAPGQEALSLAAVLDRLRSEMVVRFNPGPGWDIDSVLEPLEAPQLKISEPAIGHLTGASTELARIMRKLALAGSGNSITLKDVPRLGTWIDEIRGTAHMADQLGSAIQEVRIRTSGYIREAAGKCDVSIRKELAGIADAVLETAPIDLSLERARQVIASNEVAVREKIERIRSACKEMVEGAKTLPESVILDWNMIHADILNLREEQLMAQVEEIRQALRTEKSRKTAVEHAFSVAEDRLGSMDRPIDSNTLLALQQLVMAGDESNVRELLPERQQTDGHRLGDVEVNHGLEMGGLSASADSNGLVYGFEWQVSWKKAPLGFRARSGYSTTNQLPDPEHLLPYLHSQALEHIRRGSITSAIDFILDIFSLLPSVDAGSEIWLNRAVSLLAIVGVGTTVSGHSVGRLGQLISEETTGYPGINPPPALKALFQAPGFDESVAQLFGHQELLPFSRSIGAQLRAVAIAESPYLLEDLARGLGKSCLYGYRQTAMDLLLSVAEAEQVSSDVLHSTRTFLELISEQMGKSRATISPRTFRVPYWLQEGERAFEASVRSRGRSCARVVDDRAQSFINTQLPPIVQKSGGFSYSAGSGVLNIALLVTSPPAGTNVASYVEFAIPLARNAWLEHDAVYAVGPLSPGDKAIVPLTLDVSDPLPTTLEVNYETRVRQAGFSRTGIASGVLKVPVVARKEIVIEDYPGAVGLPITLDEKALELSSSSVRKAFKELLRSLNAGGVAAIVYGRRRRGKTSILQTISEHKQVLGRYVVHFDSKADRPFRVVDDAVRYFGNILDTALTKAGFELPSLTEILTMHPDWSAIQKWLDAVKTAIDRPVHILLLIDEFQKWLSDLNFDARTEILGIIRGVYIRQGGHLHISVILSGLSNIKEYRKASSDFCNAFSTVLEIQAFDQRASEALIRSNNSIDFDRRAVDLIRILSGGNPYLINILGNEICKYLRDKERPYCFGEDVEEVVSGQLDATSSPIWLFLQYLLKKGEEDYASEIPELPALIDLAWTLGRRGSSRDKVAIKEIEAELRRVDIAVDSRVLADQIERAAASELLVQEGDRFRFESPWLGEWLTASNDGQPISIESLEDPDLVLNRYHITKTIAHSGIAEVFRALDTQKSQGPVILKVYSSNVDTNSGVVQRESEHLSRIRHPAVVRCLNCGRDDRRGDVVVLEDVKGETLEYLIHNEAHHSSRLIGMTGDLTTQVEFIEQIAAGLADCHAVDIIHKDIKPSNIIAQCSAGKWYPKIIDFGISSEVNLLGEPTLSGYTPEYVSPEKLLNKPRKSPTDIYSLGLVAYELLTGMSPFGKDLSEESRQRRLKADFVPLKEKRSDVSLRLSELVGRMLAVDPTSRPTADTLTGELSQAQKDLDWLVLRSESLVAQDPEEICDTAFAALKAAPEAARSSLEYFELADLFVAKAGESRKTTGYARQMLQPLLLMVRKPLADPTVLSSFLGNLLAETVVDEAAREDKRVALQTLVEFLLVSNPCSELVSSVEVLLSNQNDPVIWNVRHELFLIAASYTAAAMVSDRCESWCIRACKKMRPLEGGALLETQLWLRRVESLSVSGGADYLIEKREIERLLQSQAGCSSLPDAAKVQDSKIVGKDEAGHLDVERIEAWGARVRRLYPFVEAIKRVRKAPGITGPSRVLNPKGMSLHLKAAPGIKPTRIIPAVLDQGYCIPADVMLRINILLTESCSAAQREAAIELLAADRTLFPGGRDGS